MEVKTDTQATVDQIKSQALNSTAAIPAKAKVDAKKSTVEKANGQKPGAKSDKKVEAKTESKPEPKRTGKGLQILASECPAREGSKRAAFWGKLKPGMSKDEVAEAGVPARFMKKMIKAGHAKYA